MKIIVGLAIAISLYGTQMIVQPAQALDKSAETAIINLPQPALDGPVSVEKALSERRSVRTYKNQPLSLADVSQLLWAAQGITEPKKGLRTAPSARASYLLQVYILPGKVADLPMGMYKYQPQGHKLIKVLDGDIKTNLYNTVGQSPIKIAPAVIVVTGLSKKTSNQSWIYLEAGHAVQNIYLQAAARNLGGVTMTGFKPEEVKNILKLPDDEYPVYIMPVGKK